VGSGCTGKTAAKNILNFYNYSDYIGKQTIPRFEKDYNYRVNCDYYSKQDILYAKIKIGVTGYDLIVATDLILRRFIRQNLLIPVEKQKIPNVGSLMERFANPPYDPGLKYSIPYLWGTTVIAYNKKHVSEPIKSWKDLWNPKYKGKMTMLDEKRDAIGCTLIMLGYSPNSTDRKHLKEAQAKLLEQRPLLKKYTADTYIDELASNELYIAQGWSGDVIQAMRENPDIDYVIPDEGSIIWADCMAIPTGSPHPDSARLFMDYILKPEVGAELASHVGYATPNQAAFEYLAKTNPAMVNDRRIYPPKEVIDRLYFNTDIGDEEKYWNRIWEDIKLGKA
jgi:spermidine/putrescine transport system substrate-binding protein